MVQIRYKRKAGSAKLLSMRFPETTKSSIPVAGSNKMAVNIDNIWVCSFFVWKIKDSFSYIFIEIWAIICAGKDFFGVTC